MGRETGSLHLLAPLLLTGGKGADLVIRGNVVLNTANLILSPIIVLALSFYVYIKINDNKSKQIHKTYT
jgi:hypothetical protein